MAFNIAAYLLAPLVGFLMLIVAARARGHWRVPLMWSAWGCISLPLVSVLLRLVGVPVEFVGCSGCVEFAATLEAAMRATATGAVMSLAAAMAFLTLVLAREPR